MKETLLNSPSSSSSSSLVLQEDLEKLKIEEKLKNKKNGL